MCDALSGDGLLGSRSATFDLGTFCLFRARARKLPYHSRGAEEEIYGYHTTAGRRSGKAALRFGRRSLAAGTCRLGVPGSRRTMAYVPVSVTCSATTPAGRLPGSSSGSASVATTPAGRYRGSRVGSLPAAGSPTVGHAGKGPSQVALGRRGRRRPRSDRRIGGGVREPQASRHIAVVGPVIHIHIDKHNLLDKNRLDKHSRIHKYKLDSGFVGHAASGDHYDGRTWPEDELQHRDVGGELTDRPRYLRHAGWNRVLLAADEELQWHTDKHHCQYTSHGPRHRNDLAERRWFPVEYMRYLAAPHQC